MTSYYVEIRKHGEDEPVKSMGPFSERKAEKVDSGANMNLNHEEYYTRIVSEDELSDMLAEG